MNELGKFVKAIKFRSKDDQISPARKTYDISDRRREQVRRAQRTHRERRAGYLKVLEAEVEYLRNKDANDTAELRNANIINQRLRNLLVVHSVFVPPELDNVNEVSHSIGFEVAGQEGSLRTLRALPTKPPLIETTPDQLIDATDPQTAIEFVLALEHNCLGDRHNHIGEDGEHGHAMQLQSSVMQNALSTTDSPAHQTPVGPSWYVPKTQLEEQLERLLHSSMKLSLVGEMTPVMCWIKIRERHEASPMTRSQLLRLQNELAVEMLCYGFGAIIDDHVFYATLDRVAGVR